MKITIREGSRVRVVQACAGATLLEALREAGAAVDAPCGGRGTCGKCRVLVRDGEGLSYRLACETPVSEGMEAVLDRSLPMEVSTAGSTRMCWPATGEERGLGVAFDVGTTTLACHLVDCATGRVLAARGRANPQIAFGADVISRITAAGEGHLGAMRTALAESLDALLDEVLADAGQARQQVEHVMVAGNTVMQTIAAGLDPQPIGVAPFDPPTLFGESVPFAPISDCARFAPCIAGYVGGDITCGLLAVNMRASEKPALLLDLGTNGEMVLGDASGMVACATAAGPVFEGAGIRFGMPAYPGAISRVRCENGGLRLTVIGGGEPAGLCGTGLVDAVALMLREGVLDETGLILPPGEVSPHMARFVGEDGEGPFFLLGGGICVTQRDVRNLQLAKAAVCAGVLTLLAERGLAATDVAEVLVAGGFGEHLNLENAAYLGLFPAEMLPVARSVGNAAVEGASLALASRRAARELQRIADECRYVELSLRGDFNRFYVECMAFEE